MLDIGWSELLMVAVVAVIVVGPKDLPKMLRTVGRTVGEWRRMAGDFKRQFEDAMRDSELQEIRDSVSDISKSDPLREFEQSVNRSFDEVRDIKKDVGKISIDDPSDDIDDDDDDDAFEDDVLAPGAPEVLNETGPEPSQPLPDQPNDSAGGRRTVAERAQDALKVSATDDGDTKTP